MIYVIARDSPTPMGGVRHQYRLADILTEGGYPAMVLHSLVGFRCDWFEHDTPIAYSRDVDLASDDVLVVPEEIAYYYAGFTTCPYVVFNQNPYLFLESVNFDYDVRRASKVLANPLMRGVLVVSRASEEFMNYAFPTVRVARITYGVDLEAFKPRPKTALVAYMPRKSTDSLALVLELLELRGVVEPDQVTCIDGMHESRVQEALGRARIFLSGSVHEGFGLPVAEALASGALVVGYDGEGGRELFSGPYARPLCGNDVLAFAREVERAVDLVRDESARRRLADLGRRFVAENYSLQHEASTVLCAWRTLVVGS